MHDLDNIVFDVNIDNAHLSYKEELNGDEDEEDDDDDDLGDNVNRGPEKKTRRYFSTFSYLIDMASRMYVL